VIATYFLIFLHVMTPDRGDTESSETATVTSEEQSATEEVSDREYGERMLPIVAPVVNAMWFV